VVSAGIEPATQGFSVLFSISVSDCKRMIYTNIIKHS
jgi:hypothetical protein